MPSTPGENGAALPPASVDFWIIRHGERIDETPRGREWLASVERSRRFDPPLTDAGIRQAAAAARMLRASRRSFARVWSSPLARALGTANEISRQLGLPVSVVPGLASCAAAVRRAGIDRVALLPADAMRALCPAMEAFETDAPLQFLAACEWIARRDPSAQSVLVVAHREGIKELARAPLRLPYCATARFRALFSDDDDGRAARREVPTRSVAWHLDELHVPKEDDDDDDDAPNGDQHHNGHRRRSETAEEGASLGKSGGGSEAGSPPPS